MDLDARLARFLEDVAPRDVPDRLVMATREAIAETPQRGVRRGLVPRFSSFVIAPAGSLAAVVAVVVLGSILVLSNRFGPGVAATPAPVASAPSNPPSSSESSLDASPSASACPTETEPCVPELQPGVHASTAFLPAVRYTVPAGWVNTLDDRGQFDLRFAAGGQYRYPDGLTFHDGISIFRRPVAELTVVVATNAADRAIALHGARVIATE